MEICEAKLEQFHEFFDNIRMKLGEESIQPDVIELLGGVTHTPCI